MNGILSLLSRVPKIITDHYDENKNSSMRKSLWEHRRGVLAQSV